MTADQCLEHPWLKQYPQPAQIIAAPIQHECDNIITPLIKVEVCQSCSSENYEPGRSGGHTLTSLY